MVKRKNFLLIICILASILIVYISGKTVFKKENNVTLSKYNVFNKVNEGEESVPGTNQITFDAFFLSDENDDGNAEGYRGINIRNNKTEKLYFELKINGNATLKDAKISFENDNVTVSGTIPRSSLFEKSYYSYDYESIDLNEATTGLSSFFFLSVGPKIDKDINKFSGINKVILTGTIVNNDTNEEKEIRKVVNYQVDVYSEDIKTNYISTQASSTPNSFKVRYTLEVQEEYSDMPLIESHIEGSISPLLGEKPKSVVISSPGYDNYTYSYDEDNLTFSAVKTAEIEDNVITKPAYTTTKYQRRVTIWYVDVEYERDENAKDAFVTLSADSWYVGAKDINKTLVESNKKNVVLSQKIDALSEPDGGYIDNTIIRLGDYIESERKYFVDKTPIVRSYNSPNWEELTYQQSYELSSVIDSSSSGKAVYLDEGTYVGNEEFTSYVTYKDALLSSNGAYGKTFTIIDVDTGETVLVINSKNAGQKLSFPSGVHKIRIETNELPASTNIKTMIYFTKEVDVYAVRNNYNVDNFNYGSIINYARTWQEYSNSSPNNSTIPRQGSAVFSEKSSYIEVSGNTYYYLEPSDVSIPVSLGITTNTSEPSNKLWKDGVYLLKLPELIIDVKNVRIYSNDLNTKVQNYELYSDGTNNYIKIKFTNAYESTANIHVQFDGILNPRVRDNSATVDVYGYNYGTSFYKNNVADVYDINSDGSTLDNVTKDDITLRITYPHEVTTSSMLKNYNSNGDVTIAPLIADVNPKRGSRDADVEVFVKNNSDNTINGIYIIGKVGFVGNTYQFGAGTLGTEFNSLMNGPITYDSSLNGRVNIYYSTEASPTNDINDPDNKWQTNPSNYSLIKTYMIVMDPDYELSVNEEISFEYPIDIPDDTANLNKISYHTHAAYFNYITENGIYPSTSSGHKLGVRIARQYDVDLTLFKKYANYNKIYGGTFAITAVDDPSDQRIIDFSGDATDHVEGLYVDKEYKIEQLTTFDTISILDSTVRTFKLSNGLNDELILSNSDNFRSITYDNDKTVNIELENEVTYWININNSDVDTGDSIPAIFIVTGKNHENGTRFEVKPGASNLLLNLVPGEVYHIKQVYNSDYIIQKEFDVKLVRDLDDHSFDVTTRQAPTITRSGDCDSEVLTSTSSSGFSVRTNAANPSTQKDIKCNILLNLEGYSETYNVTSSSPYIADNFSNENSSTLDIILTNEDDYESVTPSYILSKNPLTNYSGNYISGVYGTALNESIQAGTNYNLFINFHRSDTDLGNSSAPYFNLNNIKLTNANGKDELYQTKQKYNVENSDNANVKMLSVSDHPEASYPMMILNISNKQVVKKDFEIVKTDAITGEPLKGAIFKIEGPNLKEGTIITTDQEGKARIPINLSYSGQYLSYVDGIGNNSDYPKTNVYTVQEILAPHGYTVDTSKIKFIIEASYDNYNEDPTYNVTYMSNNRFKSYEILDPLVFSVKVEDYPVFRVTKTDEETGEVLPNTYYSLYKIDPLTFELTAAYDNNGNVIGEKHVINGEEVYLVKTDENGQFTLALGAGSYKLVEVIPSDEKYDITNQVTYFSIGESKGYQAKGISIDGIVNLSSQYKVDTSVNYNYLKYNARPRTYMTKDNGYIVTKKSHIIKYNSNNELVWDKELTFYDGYEVSARYYDTDTVYYSYQPNYDNATPIYTTNDYDRFFFDETDDSYYFYSATENRVFYRLDKETGDIIADYRNNPPKSPQAKYYFGKCNKQDGVNYSSEKLIPGDDEHIYCQYNNITLNWFTSTSAIYVFDANNNGYVTMVERPSATTGSRTDDDGNSYQYKSGAALMLSNGEIHYNEQGFTDYSLLKYDKNGELIEEVPLKNIINNKINEYLHSIGFDADKNLTLNTIANLHYNNIKYLNDGSVVMLLSTLYNVDTGGTKTFPTAVKLDKDNNVIFATPIVVDGYNIGSIPYKERNSLSIINDDGSFAVYYDGSWPAYYCQNNIISNDGISTLSAFNINIACEETMNMGRYGWEPWMLEFDKDGNISNAVELGRSSRSISYIDLSKEFERFYYGSSSFSPDFISKYEDGYIIGMIYSSNNFNSEQTTVKLRSGDVINLRKSDSDTYVIYKVNSDSSVEWIKQFELIKKFTRNNGQLIGVNYYKDVYIENGYLTVALNSDTYEFKEINDEQYSKANNSNENSNVSIVRFKISDEVLPEAPAQLSLDLTNFRLTYKVYLESNDDQAASFNIKTIGDRYEYTGPAPGEIESVKHGDDSRLRITITPNNGYYVKSVRVNDNEINFTSDIDGVVVLDKLENVTSEKDIYVTFDRYETKVLVHHYLEGTTTAIAPDEVYSGKVDDPYETYPQNSMDYELVKDVNGNSIYPDNYKGYYKSDNIEVIYYYQSYASLQVNFRENDTFVELDNPVISRGIKGASYQTSPKSIMRYILTGVEGNSQGNLNDDLTEVTYLYNKTNQPMVTTRFKDVETNRDIMDPVYDYYDMGLTYHTTKLSVPPTYYVYDSVSGAEEGTVDQDSIEITYFYRKQKGNVISKYLDIETGEAISNQVEETLYLGSKYETKKLSAVPDGYEYVDVSGTTKGTIDRSEVVVTYFYKKAGTNPTIKYGKVITRYVDVDSNYDILLKNEQSILYNATYVAAKYNKEIEGYKLIGVEGNETGIVNKDEITIIYKYQKIDDESQNKSKSKNPITRDNIIIYYVIFIVSTSLIISAAVLKIREKLM